MSSVHVEAVFFDLGDTLGSPVLSGQPPALVGFDVFPFVPAVLSELKGRRLKLGIISNTGEDRGESVNSVLAPTGLLGHFDHALLVYSGDESPLPDGTPVTKRVPEIFRRAEQRAGFEAGSRRCLFVGEDARERQVAQSAGWIVCPHPLLVTEVLDGQALNYVRLTVPRGRTSQPWREELRRRAFVPQYFPEPGGATVHGVTSERLAGEFGAMGFGVDLLGGANLPQTTDLYLLRDDVSARTGFLSPRGEASVAFTSKGEGERSPYCVRQRCCFSRVHAWAHQQNGDWRAVERSTFFGRAAEWRYGRGLE